MRELTINDTNRAGTMQIMDTAIGGYRTLRVTVRDMTCSGQDQTPAMRRLARRALDGARSARVIRRFNADGCPYATFEVSAAAVPEGHACGLAYLHPPVKHWGC